MTARPTSHLDINDAIRPRLQNNTPVDAVECSGDEVLRRVRDVLAGR